MWVLFSISSTYLISWKLPACLLFKKWYLICLFELSLSPTNDFCTFTGHFQKSNIGLFRHHKTSSTLLNTQLGALTILSPSFLSWPVLSKERHFTGAPESCFNQLLMTNELSWSTKLRNHIEMPLIDFCFVGVNESSNEQKRYHFVKRRHTGNFHEIKYLRLKIGLTLLHSM